MTKPLDSCWAKLARAKENINYLHNEITNFLSDNASSYTTRVQHQKNGLECALIAYGEIEIPIRFSVLAGVVIHHLRSSLDHLIYALIIQNGYNPSKKSQFPICSTLKNFEDACKRGLIDGVSISAKSLIASLQPFTSPMPDDTVFAVLSNYNNLDKHQLLVIVSTLVELGKEIKMDTNPEIAKLSEALAKPPNIVGMRIHQPQKLNANGIEVLAFELAEPVPALTMNADLSHQLAFEKCGLLDFSPVIQTLVGLYQVTENSIKLFEKEFKY